MPELPEVHTTVTELNKLIKGNKIIDIWTNYKSTYYEKQIKNPSYFKEFKKVVIGSKVKNVERRAKNILINLDNGRVILIHMKMTGHLLYGQYKKTRETWSPTEEGPLQDKMNGWIRMVFTFDNGKHLALSDMRKFAKVTLEKDLDHLGPEPLEKEFVFKIFKDQINKKPNGKIKTVLLNQEIISGIGNIYSDESLWLSKIEPETIVKKLTDDQIKNLLKNIKEVLKKGIRLLGDSMSDYRNPYGEKGNFQLHHQVYGRKNQPCLKKNCSNKIERMMLDGRSAHFCPNCQK